MRYFIAILVLLNLGACGRPDKIEPGLWAIRTAITEFDSVAGVAPPEVVFREPAPFTKIECLSADDVETPKLFSLIGAGGFGCTDSLEMRDGRLSASRTGCNTGGLPDLVSTRMRTFEGEFDGERFDIRGRSDELFSGGKRRFLSARFTGRRLGQCPAQGKPSEAPDVAEQPGRDTADPDQLQPGLWQVTTRTIDRYPAQSSGGGSYSRLYCLSAEPSGRPANLLIPPVGGSKCDEALEVRAGRIGGRRTCGFPYDPVEHGLVDQIEGRFDARSFAAQVRSRSTVTVEDPQTGSRRTEETNRSTLSLSGRLLSACEGASRGAR